MPYSSETFTDRIRQQTHAVLDPIASALHRLGVHPDTITWAGLGLVGIASLVIAQGQFQWGALLLLGGLPLDALDGAIARKISQRSRFGAVLDSALDRYADGFIFAALSYHFAAQSRLDLLVIAQLALLGSFAVSYLRARAESVGVEAKIGLFTRLERTIVILTMLFIPDLLDWGILILALGTNFTAAQRLWHVYQTLKDKGM
ncbi:MAG: CDP-alcohol phosphatidyltransferase family protein [Anaerolineae bacterium]|nr:CDP-alcohol phosphatidyltransferase family protein [Anaerolineae bacterium]MDW8173527.1 CDP-alcohol phosphatidyltransferase family protein [Anaerolineae bacterium]